jgi:hypothetical protein
MQSATLAGQLEVEAFVKMLRRVIDSLLSADIYRLPSAYHDVQARCPEIADELENRLREIAADLPPFTRFTPGR